MVAAAAKPCSYPGCGALSSDGRCAKHPREAWTQTYSQVKRVRGRALQRRRETFFRAHPLCAACERNGRVAAAAILDHVIALAEGGSDEPSNWQGLCQACSDAKTKDESTRGRRLLID